MSRILARLSLTVTLLSTLGASASAAPNCLRDPQPYALTDDTVSWAMTIVPGADCIQGLRWSYMQIEGVSLSSGLALQLPFLKASESMGNHDSKIVDAGSVD